MNDDDLLLLVVGAGLLMGKGTPTARGTPPEAGKPTTAKGPTGPATATATPAAARKVTAPAAARIPKLAARANQAAALAWIPTLERVGATKEEAAGLARWIGLESSGNPLAVSSAGERGLLQITPSTAKLALTDSEWARMVDKGTTREEHARIALKQYRWHVKRAGLPDTAATTDKLWYAKVHHMRPAALRATTARPAAPVAAKLAAGQATTDKDKVRVAAANVVAFGRAE